MSTKKVTVKANLDTSSPSKKNDGKCPFRIMVRISGQVKAYFTGFAYMNAKFWIPELNEQGKRTKQMRIKHAKGNPGSKALERSVNEKVADVLEAIEEMIKRNTPISHKTLQSKLKLGKEPTLLDVCKAVYQESKHLLSPNTLIRYTYHELDIINFDGNALISEIDLDWVTDYVKWLSFEKPAKGKGRVTDANGVERGQSRNTVRTAVQYLNKVLVWAMEKELIHKNPVKAFKSDIQRRKLVAYEEKDRNPLESHEVERMHQAYLNGELKNLTYTLPGKGNRKFFEAVKYHHILQQILASVYTGFRFGDIQKFQDRVNVRLDDRGITLEMEKVKRKHTIPVTKKLMEVLSLNNGGKLFEGKILSNQAMNQNLRRVLHFLGIEKSLTWHDLRRSFATILSEQDVDIHKISKLMGHTNVSITERYIKLRKKPLEKAMATFDMIGKPALPESEDMLGYIRDIVSMNPGLKLPAKVQKLLTSQENTSTPLIQIA